MGGCGIESETYILKFMPFCPNIELLDLNGFVALQETGLSMICKSLSKLKTILINMTVEISDAYLEEIQPLYPNTKIIRTIKQYTDAKDTELYIPWPVKKKKKKKKKGKGKKGKK